MASYDYKKGKERLEAILDNDLVVIEQNELPSDDHLTFANGYYCWVSAVFVDIRGSYHCSLMRIKKRYLKSFAALHPK